MWLFYYFHFERNYNALNSKKPCFLLNEIWTLIKMKRNQKWKIPHTDLERRTLCSSTYKNRKLKLKLWWDAARKRKRRAFFVPLILSKGNFLNICVLSQYIVHWIHILSEYTYFDISKDISSYAFLLVLKLVEIFQLLLKVLTKSLKVH